MTYKHKPQFSYKGGIATRINNNPEGYNNYKKNPTPKAKVIEIIDIKAVQSAYYEFMLAKRNLLSKADKYHRLNRIYNGLDEVKKRIELEIKEGII